MVTIVTACLDVALDNSHQVARGVKYADAVREAGVRSTWINKLRKTNLLNPTKPLERPSANELPDDVFELISSELN